MHAFGGSGLLDLIRFTTSDSVELQGWLTEPESASDIAVVHVHGMSGNGFQNPFLDEQRAMNKADGRAFFTFNNRGAGVVTWFNRSNGTELLAGACYERFEDSVRDIEAAIDAVHQRGYSQVVLQGHSLGCTKAVHYLNSRRDDRVVASVLLAPTDMRGWGNRGAIGSDGLRIARDLVERGEGERLVSEQSWDGGPISARNFCEYAEAGGPADIYGTNVGRGIEAPVLVAYGTQDVGIIEIDGEIDVWKARAVDVFPETTRYVVFEGASHSFREVREELAKAVAAFLKPIG